MNYKYALFPFCAVLLIVTALLLTEEKSEHILSIPYTYSPNNLGYLASDSNDLTLEDTTLFWEVIAQHTQSSKGLTAATETLAAGVCVFDANKDGWMDLFVVGGSGFSRHYGKKSWWNNGGGNRLLINQQGQSFSDQTEKSGLQQRQWGTACAIADLDLDGFDDIIVTGYGQNRLFKQTELTRFTDVTQESGILSDKWSSGATIGDFNKDGLPDVYITNFVQFEKGKRTFEQDTGFKSSITENFSPALYDPEPNRLYLNLGNLQFQSVEKTFKVENGFGRSLFAKWHDFNSDNWLDLLVINDFGSPNQLFLNQAGKQFVRAQDPYSAFHLAGSRDMAIVQPNKDQQPDNSAYFFSRSAGQSNVFLNKASSGTAGYVDQARSANLVSNLRLSNDNWGVIAVDINNDGYQDIYQTSGSLFADQESTFVTQSQSNNLYINSASGFYSPATANGNDQPVYSSRAVASADLNNDGQVELIVANNNAPLQILARKSTFAGSWLGLEMETVGQNYSPRQAKLEVRTEKGLVNYNLDYKQSLFAQSDPRIHLGLADLKSNVDLKISWPDGQVTEFTNIAINHYYLINKSTAQISKRIFSVSDSSNKIFELSSNTNTPESQKDIKHLLDIAFFANDKKALNILWSKANPVDKVKLLDRIAKDTNLLNQTWLFSALKDNNDQVVLAALRIFKQKEWDHSVVYLLPLFEHKNEQVVCAVSRMFAFFYDEEEAVTERKGLAVAPIMRALGSADDNKNICLLEALAASENKRAVLSVIHTLTKSTNTLVQSKAIKTLGLIRDARASIEIKRVLQTTQSAEVISAALIALTRLNDQDITNIFKRTFTPKPNEAELIRQLETLNLLLTNSDGVVISRAVVISALTEIKAFIDSFGGSSSLIVSLLQTISNSNESRFEAFAEAYLSNKNTQIQAVLTLLKIGDTSGRKKATDVLLKLSNQDLLTLLELIGKHNVSLSQNTIKELAIRAIADKPLSATTLDLGHKIGRENYQRWLVERLNQTEDAKTAVSIISYAIRFDVKGQINFQNMQWNETPEVISSYLKWQYIQSTGYSANQLLKLRLLLNRLLRENQLSIEERQALLIVAAKRDPFVANNFLINNSLGLTKQQIVEILIELPPLQRTNEQIKLYERILENQHLPQHDRLVAAVGLLSTHPDRKQEILAKL